MLVFYLTLNSADPAIPDSSKGKNQLLCIWMVLTGSGSLGVSSGMSESLSMPGCAGGSTGISASLGKAGREMFKSVEGKVVYRCYQTK